MPYGDDWFIAGYYDDNSDEPEVINHEGEHHLIESLDLSDYQADDSWLVIQVPLEGGEDFFFTLHGPFPEDWDWEDLEDYVYDWLEQYGIEG
jgi:hypothetical protein